MEAVINYLNWDREDRGRATELFHEFHGFDNDIPEIDATEFEDLYREVRTLEDAPSDPEHIWRQWNRGSGYESDEFLEMRYCEPCDTYQIGSSQAVQHAVENHGYDAFDETGEPEYVHGIRSMSVGDVIQTEEDEYHVTASIGFEELDIGGEL